MQRKKHIRPRNVENANLEDIKAIFDILYLAGGSKLTFGNLADRYTKDGDEEAQID